MTQPCSGSCCLVQSDVTVLDTSDQKIPLSAVLGSNQISFDIKATSPKEVVIDLQKNTEVSGFQILTGIKSFQMTFRKDGFKEDIYFRSPDTDEIVKFEFNGDKVFFPDRIFVLARWFQLKNIEWSDKDSKAVLDVLGCCSSCGAVPTTVFTTVAPPTSSPGKKKVQNIGHGLCLKEFS